jgi:hypothetical protein
LGWKLGSTHIVNRTLKLMNSKGVFGSAF